MRKPVWVELEAEVLFRSELFDDRTVSCPKLGGGASK